MTSSGRRLLQVALALLLRPAIASQALTPFANFSIYALVPPFESVYVCNSSCQADQRKALQLFYNETKGDNWTVSTEWTPVDMSSGSFNNQTHCNWFGVSCCSVNNTVQGNGNTCNTPGGIASITLPNNNLNGTLSDDFIAAMEQTITIIDLHGNDFSPSADYLMPVCPKSHERPCCCTPSKLLAACHCTNSQTGKRQNQRFLRVWAAVTPHGLFVCSPLRNRSERCMSDFLTI